jgi:hypothetical protein
VTPPGLKTVAESVIVLPTKTFPDFETEVKEGGGAVVTAIVREVAPPGPAAFVAKTLTVLNPLDVGVPEIRPVFVLRVSPAGKPLAE